MDVTALIEQYGDIVHFRAENNFLGSFLKIQVSSQ
jgi:hypothetical protein